MVTCRHCLVVKATLQAEGSCLHWKGFTWKNIDVISSFSWNNIVEIVSSGLVFGLEHFSHMPFSNLLFHLENTNPRMCSPVYLQVGELSKLLPTLLTCVLHQLRVPLG